MIISLCKFKCIMQSKPQLVPGCIESASSPAGHQTLSMLFPTKQPMLHVDFVEHEEPMGYVQSNVIISPHKVNAISLHRAWVSNFFETGLTVCCRLPDCLACTHIGLAPAKALLRMRWRLLQLPPAAIQAPHFFF
jgi:hypothetical protein